MVKGSKMYFSFKKMKKKKRCKVSGFVLNMDLSSSLSTGNYALLYYLKSWLPPEKNLCHCFNILEAIY